MARAKASHGNACAGDPPDRRSKRPGRARSSGTMRVAAGTALVLDESGHRAREQAEDVGRRERRVAVALEGDLLLRARAAIVRRSAGANERATAVSA